MLDLALVTLGVYLAAVIGVSGIAKLERPDLFAATLRLHRLLPPRTIAGVSISLPWIQIAVAAALVSSVGGLIPSVVALGLFLCFVVVELILVLTKRATECGCYGVAYRIPVDAASVAASVILFLLAATHLALMAAFGPPPLLARVAASAFMGTSGAILVLRTLGRRNRRHIEFGADDESTLTEDSAPLIRE